MDKKNSKCIKIKTNVTMWRGIHNWYCKSKMKWVKHLAGMEDKE